MTEIIPAILTDNPAELERLLTALKAAGATRVHLDILDDTLVPGRTIGPEHFRLGTLNGELLLDVHLMVAKPSEHISSWERVPGLSRIIAHVEADDDLEQVGLASAKAGREFWAALNPDTALGKLTGLSCHLDGAMFMTVVPGAQGRPFRDDVLEKIRLLKSERPELSVMVDGGINPKTAPLCAHAGASVLVSGSFIVKSPDPADALAHLHASIEG